MILQCEYVLLCIVYFANTLSILVKWEQGLLAPGASIHFSDGGGGGGVWEGGLFQKLNLKIKHSQKKTMMNYDKKLFTEHRLKTIHFNTHSIASLTRGHRIYGFHV